MRLKEVRKGKRQETLMRYVFALAAVCCIAAVVLICLFLFSSGLPFFSRVDALAFLGGTKWAPDIDDAARGTYQIFPMMLGSIYVTGGAMLVGCPIGILAGVYVACFCPAGLKRILRPMIALMAGVPSVVYGFFGITTLVPLVRNLFGGNGFSVLTASLLLGMMVLPTVIQLTASAVAAVPACYFEGSLSLGATEERSAFCATVPAARSGILAAVVLAMVRAIGESMAVVMVAGNQPRMPKGLLQGVRTLTGNIVIEMGYAAGLHREALIATGVVLFTFILLINLLLSALKRGNV